MKKRKQKFKPNRAYIDQAMREFRQRGGKIKLVVLDDEAYQEFMQGRGDGADDFLRGKG